jgi:CheY-like chemotaxis protein
VDVYESAARGEWTEDEDDSDAKLLIKPEVVLMDINMLVMDGFEAVRVIRQFQRTSGSTPATIVAVTGLCDTSAQEQAFASGMDIFLTKPMEMKEMNVILSKLRGADA